MGPAKVCRPDNCSQIVGILNIIQKKQKRRFPLFLCQAQHILHRPVFIGCPHGNYTLMPAGRRHLIQPLLCHILYDDLPLSRLPLDGLHRAVLNAVLDIKLLHCPACAQGLNDCIASFYEGFLCKRFIYKRPFSLIFLLVHFLFLNPLPAHFNLSSPVCIRQSALSI